VSKPKSKHHKENRKLANQRKQTTVRELGLYGASIDDELSAIGVVIKDLTVSQLAYTVMRNVNVACKNYVGIDWHLFVHQSVRPCIEPTFPVGQLQHMLRWRHPLIATDTASCLYALQSRSVRIYHYVFDLDFLGDYARTHEQTELAFQSDRISMIARHPSYADVIESEFGVKCVATIPEFDVRQLCTLIAGDMK
jgi:hypothetical protein